MGEFAFKTGPTMHGYVRVDAAGIAEPADLAQWVGTGANLAASLPRK